MQKMRRVELQGYESVQIAQRLIDVAGEHDNAFTPMQLLKLVYLCHGWMLGLYRRPLVREDVLAWQYGPVIRELYASIKEYGSRHVFKLLSGDLQLDEIAGHIVGQVYERYGHFTGIELSSITHAEGTPWHITWDGGRGRNRVISNDLIEHYFVRLANRHQGRSGP